MPKRGSPVVEFLIGSGTLWGFRTPIRKDIARGINRPPLGIANARNICSGTFANEALLCLEKTRLSVSERHAVRSTGEGGRELQLERIILPVADLADVI